MSTWIVTTCPLRSVVETIDNYQITAPWTTNHMTSSSKSSYSETLA